ncbi:hypothetical protein BH09BAC3_BH09BAC3_01540 [soil metagenome]
MKTSKYIVSLLILLCSCAGKKDYNPATYLTAFEQVEVMTKIIRYMAKPPENLTFEERFYKGYDAYYNEQMSLHRLDAFYVDDNGTRYFMVSRIAPSLTEKRVAIGGTLKLDEQGKLIEYEEVFRTWKMTPDILAKKSAFLFDRMARGANLEPYYTKNLKDDEYIEFPDDHTYFDKSARLWQTK